MFKRNGKQYILVGALARPLHEQLGVTEAATEQFQLDANAIVRLRVRGTLSEAEGDRACRRLVKRLNKELPELLRQTENDEPTADTPAATAGAKTAKDTDLN